MTQLTARWIRGGAVVLNALVFVRSLYGLLCLLLILANPRVVSNVPGMSVQLGWMSLAVLASLLAIVALVWMNRPADSRMVPALPGGAA